ncbi:MAG TPA: SEC-C domain-containing protein [Anaerolineae bacterium]|nr:SEC-C domain-containing protein [Anaerolineae bacterium]
MVRRTLITIVAAVGVLLALALGAFVVVLLAAGVGALLARLFPFSMFESTLLSLIALIGVVVVIWRAVTSILRTPSPGSDEDDEEELIDPAGRGASSEWEDEDYDWEDEDEDWDAERDEESSDQPDLRPPLRGWQQPIQRTEFERVGRNEPCPCGSGRKYKNCHGRPGHAT